MPSDVVGTSPPPGWAAPLLTWFRGANATVTQYDDRIVADMLIDIERKSK